MNFPPVYVVSLARAVERREKMRAQLEGLGMRAEFTDAIDGASADFTPYSDRLHPDKWRVLRGRELSNAAIACYLSHYRIWERVAASGEQCALVLEDDALLHDGFCDVVRELQNCRWQWDVIMLSGRKRRPIDTVLDKIGGTGRRLVRYRVRVGGAVAYLVSSSGAKKLLTQCREICAPVDWRYAEWWLNGLAFYYVNPFVASNAPVPSIITRPRRLSRTFGEWLTARRLQFYSFRRRHYARLTTKPRLAPRTDKPLTLGDIAEPHWRSAGLALRLRRLLRKVWHSLPPRKATRVVTRGGIRYALNNREPETRAVLKNGFWEANSSVYFFNAARKRGAKVFLDIGANFGYYSLLAARLGIFDEIHAFEPHPETYRRLLWHIRANNFEGVITPHNVAASDASREMRMNPMGAGWSGGMQVFGDTPRAAPEDEPEWHKLFSSEKTGETLPVDAAPMDDMFAFNGRKIAAKIDVEGHELAAVKGMKKMLAGNDVFLQIEIFAFNTAEIKEMQSRGLTVTHRCGDDFYFVNNNDD